MPRGSLIPNQEANSAFATRDVVHLVSVGGVAIYPGETKVEWVVIPIDTGFFTTDSADGIYTLW